MFLKDYHLLSIRPNKLFLFVFVGKGLYKRKFFKIYWTWGLYFVEYGTWNNTTTRNQNTNWLTPNWPNKLILYVLVFEWTNNKI